MKKNAKNKLPSKKQAPALKRSWLIAFAVVYGMTALALSYYSYFQVDFNLTLINHPLFLQFQNPMMDIGYYNRPLSTNIFIGFVMLLFILYIGALVVIRKFSIPTNYIVVLLVGLTMLLFFSYPASLSHDIFNYMFDARIFTEYGQNPYTHKALDFTDDPWIRFMHWTHRTYPYGPLWLAVSIPLSFLGGGKFIIVLALFKLLLSFSYLVSAFFIYRILHILSPDNSRFGVVFFALNPLVLIENLISLHNDSFMIMLALFAIFMMVQQKKLQSMVVVGMSVAVKFTTVYLVPFLVIQFRPLVAFVCAVGTFAVISNRIGIQPWYFLWVVPIAALATEHRFIQIFTITMSFVLLLRYLPFIATGSWYPSAVPFQFWVTTIGIGFSIVLYAVTLLFQRVRKEYSNGKLS